MVATLEGSPARQRATRREVTVAVAHQKGGVGKSTSTALLAAEMAWLRPDLHVVVEDLDPDANLTSRWPGDTDQVRLVRPKAEAGDVRLLDTGPGNPARLVQVLRRADLVVVPVRMEPMTVQALGLFLPRLRALQDANTGAPRLAGLLLTHYVGRSADHARMRDELEAFARRERTRVLGVVPFTTAIGMHLSTRGHHYRPAARALLEVVDGRA
jgi:cellulose biosynthesis protein BcsQ